MHPNVHHKDLIPKIEIDLTKYGTESERSFALESFIMSRARESME